jgi:hypothetical protein
MNRDSKNGSAKRKTNMVRVPVTVRLPEHIVQKIDEELEVREVPLSRNHWLLEAAVEKLRKSTAGKANGAK